MEVVDTAEVMARTTVATPTATTKKGLCKSLGGNVSDYGQKAAADQMQTSWEKITEYVGTLYGQDISNGLHNKTTVAIAEPTLPDAVILRNAVRVVVIRNGHGNIQGTRRVGEELLQLAVDEGLEARAPMMELAILQNEIAAGELELSEQVPVQLTDSKKTQNNNHPGKLFANTTKVWLNTEVKHIH